MEPGVAAFLLHVAHGTEINDGAHTRDHYHHDSTQTINVEAQREDGKARCARFVELDADRTVQRDQNQRRDGTCEGRDDGWRGYPDTPFTQDAASDSDHDCG